MAFSDSDLKAINRGLYDLKSKYFDLILRITAFNFIDEKSREYATHGLSRRLKILTRAIENVFRLIPPESSIPVDSLERADAEISLHAFLINLQGAIDNLAWVFVLEAAITKDNGIALSRQDVGLRKRNKLVRRSLPAELNEYLQSLDNWLEYVENFRDALAHRIPAYIPSHIVDQKHEATYKRIEREISRAIAAADFKTIQALYAERLSIIRPGHFMLHSFQETKTPVRFHAQILCDFLTIEEVTSKFFDALEKLHSS